MTAILLGAVSYRNAAAEPGSAGRVVHVVGNAKARNKALRVGDGIFPGDEIRTEDGSGVKLLMADRTILDIGPSTTFRIGSFKVDPKGGRQVDVALDEGSVRANVTKKLDGKSRFYLRTKSSVMAVRGTELVADWQMVNGEVNHSVTVLEGWVNFMAGGAAGASKPIDLNAGRQLNLTGLMQNNVFQMSTGAAFRPVVLTPGQLNEIASSRRLADRTFTNSILVGQFRSGQRGEGQETLRSVSRAVEGRGPARRPASHREIADTGAAGQNACNGGCPIPGFRGLPGTNLPSPRGLPLTPQVPVNLTVVFNP